MLPFLFYGRVTILAKKFRNTKARRREIRQFTKEWQRALNKVYYQKRTYGVDFKPMLPVNSKIDIYDLPTKEIKKLNKELTKINEPKSEFFSKTTFARGTFATSKVDRIRTLDAELESKQQEIDKHDNTIPVIIGRNQVSEDTVLSRRLMGKKNLNYTTALKPYDFDKPKDERSLDSAIRVRENRLNPEWHRERREIMKENYINSFIDLFNDEADEVVEKLKKIPAEDFYDLYQQFEAIDFNYVPSGQDKASEEQYHEMQLVSQILDDFLDGKVKTNGKVFN